MIPLFIILGILFFLIISFLLLYFSIIEIDVKKVFIDTLRKKNVFLIYIRLRLLKKLTWAKIKIDNKGIEKYRNINNEILKNISKNLRKEIISKDSIDNLKKFEIKFKKINLNAEINLLDPITTSISVASISSILSIFFAKNIEEYSSSRFRYIIKPIYDNKPQIKVRLNCIINVKMVHIISIIYMLLKKESAKNYGKSSYRRAYAYRNE